MIGQKWVRRNELLTIDIEPNENLKVYEKLRNNLSYLKDAFGYKIKREDDETNILRNYEDFMTTNEIFMLDIFNDIGINYNSTLEEKKNLFDVYVNIYFPLILYDKFEHIINLLNNKVTNERDNIENEYILIKNDNKIEKEIYNTVEKSKSELDKFNKYFSENYIIQSNIHLSINNPKNLTGTPSNNKYNLYRIFDNFILNDKYPFIQYQTTDGHITYKYYTKSVNIENSELLAKWFENAPYGISFRILIIEDKFVTINLYETGRIEYKVTWKEDEQATIKDIIYSYNYVKDLSISGKLSKQNVKDARYEQKKIIKELKSIKHNLDEITNNNNDIINNNSNNNNNNKS
jgi:hypothetical protein